MNKITSNRVINTLNYNIINMGSPLSGKLAELYLKQIEKHHNKQRVDSNELSYYVNILTTT